MEAASWEDLSISSPLRPDTVPLAQKMPSNWAARMSRVSPVTLPPVPERAEVTLDFRNRYSHLNIIWPCRARFCGL